MSAFKTHCHDIVKEYVQTVLIIDDGAGLKENNLGENDAEIIEFNDDSFNPMTQEEDEVAVDLADIDLFQPHNVTHSLNALELTNAFYDLGIVAGLYQPKIIAEESPEAFAHKVKKVSATADIIILDWMLIDHDDRYSKAIVKQVLAQDLQMGGRLRTIIIYTGESRLHELRDSLWDYLDDESLDKSADYQISSEHLSIVFYNKGNIPGLRFVSERDLPNKALNEFSSLVDGLVPAFAMKVSSTIRNSTGRLISKFNKELDVGYLVHRALLPNVNDSEVFMLENIVSYLRNVLAINQIDKHALNAEKINEWVEDNYEKFTKKIDVSKKEVDVSKEQLSRFLTDGFEKSVYDVLITSGVTEKNARKFVESKSSILKLISILDTDEQKSSDSSKVLAVQTSFRRTFCDILNNIELPYLTQGTILYRKKDGDFYLCVTPKCDTARVESVRMFSFTKLTRLQEGKQIDIVIPLPVEVKDDINNKVERNIQIIKDDYGHDVESSDLDRTLMNKPEFKEKNRQVVSLRGLLVEKYALVSSGMRFYDLLHIEFCGGADHRVLPIVSDKSNLVFISQEVDDEFIWIGDLEDLDTQKRVSNLVGNFNRVGTDEVEWLRRQYQK